MSKAEAGMSMGTLGALRVLMRSACSGALCEELNGAFGRPRPIEERASVLLAGGIMQHGYQCGMTWGAALAAGAEAYRRHGAGPRAEAAAIVAAQRLVETFRGQNGALDCLEITDIDRSTSGFQMFAYFFLKGGTLRCARRVARFVPAALAGIDETLPAVPAPPSTGPVSCAAALVRRLGHSDERATMAAGFAGGVGLCGGACGALGAAIWVMGLRELEGGAARVDYRSPASLAVIEAFLKVTDYEFECSAIVGRAFDDVADHAGHVGGGGCARLLDGLVAAVGVPAAAGADASGSP